MGHRNRAALDIFLDHEQENVPFSVIVEGITQAAQLNDKSYVVNS